MAAMLPDGKRLHLQHGPIDLVIGVDGDAAQVARAHSQARAAFATVLQSLVDELPLLRTNIAHGHAMPVGVIARRMAHVVLAHSKVINRAARAGRLNMSRDDKHGLFVTPMAAVAGAVADHILGQLLAGTRLSRAYVNNGGDMALYLSPGTQYQTGIVVMTDDGDPTAPIESARAAVNGLIRIRSADSVRGIATSGWRGRSHSLGIADSVTVLAQDAVNADVAATLIANQVDLPDCPLIQRTPAAALQPDSDLGQLPVTTAVARLPRQLIERALQRGAALADALVRDGLIHSAVLNCQGQVLVCGASASLLSAVPAGSGGPESQASVRGEQLRQRVTARCALQERSHAVC